MNTVYWIITLIINFLFIIFMFRKFGKIGLFSLIPFFLVLANIETLKLATIFGITTVLGNIAYGSVFLITDAISEIYGKKEAKKAVFIGLLTTLMFMILLQLFIKIVPADGDFAQESLMNLFSLMPRIVIASLVTYFISNNIDIYIFHKIRKKTKGKKLWARNITSTLLAQLLDTVLFNLLAFSFVFSIKAIISIMIFNYVIKVAILFLDTPFLYLIKRINKNKWIEKKT